MMKNYEFMFTALKKIELLECEMPTPGPGEFVAQTILTQISTGTELTMLEGNVYEGSLWPISYPTRPGYNNVARIVAVGEGVSPDLIGKRIHSGAKHTKFFKWSVADTGKWRFVPDEVNDNTAVFCTMANVAMASIRTAQLRPGDVCVVFGAGIVGQMVSRLALICGAQKVFLCDRADSRLEKALKHPGLMTINCDREDVPKFVAEHNEGRLADVVFEATSDGSLAQRQLECLAAFGKLIITSNPKCQSTVDFDLCNRNNLTVIGAANPRYHRQGGTEANRWTSGVDIKFILELMRQGRFVTEDLITHEFSFKDAVAVYDMMMKDRTQALGVNFRWDEE